jgi:hypothetical protein
MAQTWNKYLKWVLPEVQQCPIDQCLDAIRQAAIEFCKLTRAYHVLTTGQAINSATTPHDVPITIPAGAAFWTPRYAVVTMGGQKYDLVPKGPQDLDGLVEHWRTSEDTPGEPLYMTTRTSGSLVVAPWPSSSGTISYDVSFIPSPSSIDGPDFLLNEQGLLIGQGAKGILLMQGTQKWGKPDLGAAYWAKFKADCGGEQTRYDRGQVDATITTRSEYQ